MQRQPHRLHRGLNTGRIEPGLPLPLQAACGRRASLPLQRALHLHRVFARCRQVFDLQGHRRHVKRHWPARQLVRKAKSSAVQGEVAHHQRPGRHGRVALRLRLQPVLKHPTPISAAANRHPRPLQCQLAQGCGSARHIQLQPGQPQLRQTGQAGTALPQVKLVHRQSGDFEL